MDDNRLTENIDGAGVVIKKLRLADLKQPEKFQEFINSLVAEDAKILVNTPRSLEEEVKWVRNRLKQIKKGSYVCLVAWSGEMMVGSASCEIKRERKNHIAEFAIAIREGFRGQGLGFKLGQGIIKLAQQRLNPRPRFIQLGVYENNQPAFNLYQKLGFQEIARVPKQIQYDGRLIGEIILQLPLAENT